MLAAVTTAAFLSACGGGDAPVASTLDFPLKTAYVTDFNAAGALPFTISGTAAGVALTGTGTLTRSAPTVGSFEGGAALLKVSTVTGSRTSGGVTLPFATTLQSYADVSFNPVGTSDAEYRVVTGTVSIPLSAKVNDSGALYTANRYASSTKAQLLGTATFSYALKPATATTALLELVEVDQDTGGAVTATTTVAFEITASGGLTRRSETLVTGTDTLTLTYNP